ncbi:MAG: hypothetical protein II811_03835, partial [Spirochaetaceae bacterium]|nr:hypothetical protein [Spirochaetaceae bacterium]
SAERAWISIPGVIKEISGFEAAAAVSGVRDVLPRNKIGDTVDFPRNNVQKCGNVIAVAPTFAESQNAAHEAIRRITLRLSPNNGATDAFLRGESRSDEAGFPPIAYPKLREKIDERGFSHSLEAGKKATDWFLRDLIDFAEEDWNHCTIRQTLERFDSLFPNHPNIPTPLLLNAILLGGIQGALYVSDSLAQSK